MSSFVSPKSSDRSQFINWRKLNLDALRFKLFLKLFPNFGILVLIADQIHFVAQDVMLLTVTPFGAVSPHHDLLQWNLDLAKK